MGDFFYFYPAWKWKVHNITFAHISSVVFCHFSNMYLVSVSVAARLQVAAANLLSEIKSVCRTTQKTSDTLVSGVNGIVDLYLTFLMVCFLNIV